MTNSKDSNVKITIDGRTKDEVIRDLHREIGRLNDEVINIRASHREFWEHFLPQLPDEMRARSRTVWEAALHAHESATAGQPGPIAVIASALLDAEKQGPRRLKGGDIDPVVFIAERIESIAKANGHDVLELFARISQRMIQGSESLLPREDPADEP